MQPLRWIINLSILCALPILTCQARELDVKADNVVINYKDGTVTFNKEVKLRLEELSLTTDKIILILKKDSNKLHYNHIDKIIIPSKFSAIGVRGCDFLRGEKAEFDAKKEELSSKGRILIIKGQNSIIANEILYQLKHKKLQVMNSSATIVD